MATLFSPAGPSAAAAFADFDRVVPGIKPDFAHKGRTAATIAAVPRMGTGRSAATAAGTATRQMIIAADFYFQLISTRFTFLKNDFV